ncbi:sulfur carrier protein ThiS adenylyltransferase ThiF [Desulfosarcina sp. OttesenSCG-928-A07]|nr:sulfur carrier protein ThiS adenylyltransferase ThiF [Desulfosarcina sp. OttesenSCG-928-A07]
MKIGIAGVGGIGSNVAVNLVRSGVSHLLLVDMDQVEEDNLNRQFYFHDQIGKDKVTALSENLTRIQPDLHLETRCQRIDETNCRHIFADCAIVVEGLDRPADKKMLVEHCGNKKLVVSACGIAGAALWDIRVRRIGSALVVGDFSSDCRMLPLFAHKVGSISNHMTQLILGRYFQ